MEDIKRLEDINKLIAKDEAYYRNPLIELINSFILSTKEDGIELGITENELTEILNCSTVAFLHSIPQLVTTEMESLSYKIVTKDVSNINLTDLSFVEILLNNSDIMKHVLIDDNSLFCSDINISEKYESTAQLKKLLRELKINIASIFGCNEK